MQPIGSRRIPPARWVPVDQFLAAAEAQEDAPAGARPRVSERQLARARAVPPPRNPLPEPRKGGRPRA